jgi:hypothetical protein
MATEKLAPFPFLNGSLRLDIDIAKNDPALRRMREHTAFVPYLPDVLEWREYQCLKTPDQLEKLNCSFEAYKRQTSSLEGFCAIQHRPRFGSEIGRLYPYVEGTNKGQVIHYMDKTYRESVYAAMNGVDFDMKKAHPSIILAFLRLMDKSKMDHRKRGDFDRWVKTIRTYVENPSGIAQECISALSGGLENGVTEKDIKLLFNRMSYGGGYYGWKQELVEGYEMEYTYEGPKRVETGRVVNFLDDFQWPLIVKNYHCTMAKIADELYQANEDIANNAVDREKHREKMMKKGILDEDYILGKYKQSFLSEVLCTCEAYITANTFFAKEDDFIKINGWDGCTMLFPDAVSAEEASAFVNAANLFVEDCGVEFVQKPFTKADPVLVEKIKTILRSENGKLWFPMKDDMSMTLDFSLDDGGEDGENAVVDLTDSAGDDVEVTGTRKRGRAAKAGKAKKARKNGGEADGSDGVLTDLEAAQKLFSCYPHWKFCENDLYVFDQTTRMWSSERVIHNKVISSFEHRLRVATLNDEGKRVIRGVKSYGNTESLRTKIFPFLQQLCVDKTWMVKSQPTSHGKLLFQNGYWDSTDGIDGKFHTEPNPDIVFFACIPHDFDEKTDNVAEQLKIKQTLFTNPLGDQQAEFLIQNIACGLMGRTMKRVLMGLGGTNCGKSTLTKAMIYACGDLVGTFNGENFAYQSDGGDEAKALRWALLLRNKRLIFSNEMSNKQDLNGNMIKKISSGGDKLVGRTHGGNEAEFTTSFLPICFANDLPKIVPFDDAVNSRIRVLNFKREFVDVVTHPEVHLKMDPGLDDTMKKSTEFQRHLVRLLINAYQTFLKNGCQETVFAEVEEAKDLWVGESAEGLIERLLAEIEITDVEADYMPSAEIESIIGSLKLGAGMQKFAAEMKKHCEINRYKNVKRTTKKVKGKSAKVWLGLKKIFEESTETNKFVSTLASSFNPC